MSPSVEPFVDDSGDATVRGTWHRPTPPGVDVLILTHGAGSNHEAPVLRAVAERSGA